MKTLTKIGVIAGTVCCLSLSSAAMANSHGSWSSSSNMTQTQKKNVGLSFVIDAEHGKLTQIAGKKYQLVVPAEDVKSILGFSSRPDRVAKQFTPEEFNKLIHKGSDSFDTNPPNAAVTFEGKPSIAFEITGFKKDGNNIVYELLLLGSQDGPENQSGPVSLFVDDLSELVLGAVS